MPRTETRRRVVVTGIGGVTNVGDSAQSIWDAYINGRSGIRAIDPGAYGKWGPEHWSVLIAGVVDNWDPTTRLDAREIKRLDRFATLGIFAAMEAVENSGLDFQSVEDPERCGVVIGSGVGGIQTIEEGNRILDSKGPKRISPFTVPRLMANAIAGDISIRFGLKGPSSSHTTACASSGHSMGDAFRTIVRGDADVMLAGGAEGAISPLCLAAFMTMRALSTRNDEPQKASRPFDKDRDGFVLSEGAAVLVLESEEHAKARGADIICEFVGYGASSDASHITAPDPEGRGAANAMRWALRDAEINPEQVSYINAHGTSTPLGDAAELAAVKSVFGDHARVSRGGKLLMSSTKSMTGHCLGASGGVEAIGCVKAIRHGVVPPTINLENPDDGADMDLVPHTAREANVEYVLNNTFGFGGHNVSLVFGSYRG